MHRDRFYAAANIPEDSHGSVKRAILRLISAVNSDADCRATIVVPNLTAINTTVVPEVLDELGMGALFSTREFKINNCTLTLCSEGNLGHGHGNNNAYLIIFSLADFIDRVDRIPTWNTLIVVASEENARAWRGANVTECI
jgi:hypothetical protein